MASDRRWPGLNPIIPRTDEGIYPVLPASVVVLGSREIAQLRPRSTRCNWPHPRKTATKRMPPSATSAASRWTRLGRIACPPRPPAPRRAPGAGRLLGLVLIVGAGAGRWPIGGSATRRRKPIALGSRPLRPASGMRRRPPSPGWVPTATRPNSATPSPTPSCCAIPALSPGNEAAAGQDRITAYRALSQTVAIEPDYRHAQALFDTATREAPRQALAGTIIRRTDGDRPGLYLRRADGSEWWLAGSDVASAVLTTRPDTAEFLHHAPDGPGRRRPARSLSRRSGVATGPPSSACRCTDAGGAADSRPVRQCGVTWRSAAQGVWSMGIGRAQRGTSRASSRRWVPRLQGPSHHYIQAAAAGRRRAPASTPAPCRSAGHQLLLGRYYLRTVSPQTRLYRLTSDTLHLLTEVPGRCWTRS